MLHLKKAFETVSHERFLLKLEHYGVKGVAFQLLKSYLTDKKQNVNTNKSISILKPINVGYLKDQF